MEIEKVIGKRIAELRKVKQLSQEELAAKTDLHEDYIGKIERGERSPSIKRLAAITVALEINLSEFFREI